MPEVRNGENQGALLGHRPGESPETVLFQLEERYGRLCSEVAALEARLRELRTAAELCPFCGGSCRRWVR